MKAFESLQQLFKSLGACTYSATPEALPGVHRHTITFQTDLTSTTIPCLDDSAGLTLRYNDARVEWQLAGSLFGYTVPPDCADPAVFMTLTYLDVKRRVQEFRTFLGALKATVGHGIEPQFVDWLRNFQQASAGNTFALRDQHGNIVGGGHESPTNTVKVFFSTTGAFAHRFGWYEPSATHIWPVHWDTVDSLNKRCDDYLKDVLYLVSEAVRILRSPELVG